MQRLFSVSPPFRNTKHQMQAVCPRCQLLPQPHQPTAVAVACFMAKELADPSCQCIMLGALFNLLHPLSSSQSSFLSFSGIRVSLSGNRPLTLFFFRMLSETTIVHRKSLPSCWHAAPWPCQGSAPWGMSPSLGRSLGCSLPPRAGSASSSSR